MLGHDILSGPAESSAVRPKLLFLGSIEFLANAVENGVAGVGVPPTHPSKHPSTPEVLNRFPSP